MNEHDEVSTAFVGSIGIVRRFINEVEQWLMIRDDELQVYRMIQSQREEGETYRECLHKNLIAELGLNPKKDYIISGLSMAHHQAPIEWPGEETPQWVIVQFFPVHLYGQKARDLIDQHPRIRWFTLTEIAQASPQEGYQFDSRQLELIERADIIPAHIKANL
ncbi:MAG: hypothetical protein HUJ26_10070 [Planctomycetaceae bacterium]|nr:hypothetical protein [Planctomycetaceae bacterium]